MIVCGTGHRPNKLGGYSQDAHTELIKVAVAWLRINQPKTVISGMALGWDQALAWAAVQESIPFIAAVPFKGMESKWPASSIGQFNLLLARASGISYVCEPGYAPWKMQKRNEWMVDNADLVLALWNGTDGGTANCLKYANKVGKPVDNLWSIWSVKP